MATTRYKGANSSERLSLSTLSDSDMFQTRHLPGTVNDADKGVSKSLLQALPIAVCATAAATAAKVATLAAESCPDFTLVNGRVVHIYFSAANEASTPTLNLAGTGAIPITYPNGDFVGDWPAGCTLDLMYINIVDGNTSIERWVLVSNLPVNEVTANNMHSVTSNAVAKCSKFVVNVEVDTGMTWNGNKIYRKVIDKSFQPNTSYQWTVSTEVASGNYQAVDLGMSYVYGVYGTRQPWFTVNYGMNELYIDAGVVYFNSKHATGRVSLVCYYCKTNN